MTLNWPAVVLLLGLVAIGVFRAPIARLLERTEKVKDWLVAPKQPAPIATSDQSLPTRSASDERKAVEALTKGFSSQLLLIQEDSIRTDLARHGLSTDGATDKVLLRHLAGTQIALRFERAYSNIYGSQLQALRWLNAQSAGVSANVLLPYYQQAAAAWPAIYTATDFRAWLGFLAVQGLITEAERSAQTVSDAEPFGIAITVSGREFLTFLVNGGRADPSVG